MEPAGAVFKLPFAFKYLHGDPIGEVFDARVGPTGIHIKAKFSTLDPAAPAHLHARIEEAWHSIKARPPLVRGLSIGWAPIESEPIRGTRYQRHKTWHLGEVSAVVVPANAECSITAIKQYDAPSRVSSTLPAVVGRDRRDRTMTQSTPPIAAQIEGVSAQLKTKSARLEELMQRDGTDGGLEAAEVTERDTLTGEVETLSTRLKGFRAIESAQLSMARPLTVTPPNGNTNTVVQPQIPRVEVKALEPGIEFARYVICRMAAVKAAASGNFVNPLELAKHYYPDHPRIQWALKAADLLQKDNIPAGTTTDNIFASPLVQAQTLANEFVEFLRPQTLLGRIPGLRRVPFNVRITGQTSGATGYWVGQGQAKPLTRYGFGAQSLGYHKVATIIAITDELARFSSPSAETLVRDELVAALRERLDIDFVDPTKAAVTGVSPASITNGVTNLNDTGATLANTITDIQQFFNAMIGNNFDLSQCVWIMPTSVALQLSLMRDSLGQTAFPTITVNGGTWQGLPVIVSQYLVFSHTPANNKVLLVHTPSIAIADDGGFQVDVSREASLEMDDQPVMASSSIGATPGSPTGPTGSAMVSMFQTDSIAIRAERFITWARLRTGAVVWMDDVRWAA